MANNYSSSAKEEPVRTISTDSSEEHSSSLSGWLTGIIVIWGLIHYYFRSQSTGVDSFLFWSSILLFIFAVFALSLKYDGNKRFAILLPVIAFVIWYFFFGASLDFTFLITLITSFIILSVVISLFSKGASVRPELAGFIPVLFLFLDVGLLPLLTERFNLPIIEPVKALVLLMPWWATYGLFTLPESATRKKFIGPLISLGRVFMVVYVIFAIIIPSLPGVGYDDSLLPGIEEFEEAQNRFRGSATPENRFLSSIKCFGELGPGFNSCIEQKQETSKITNLCKQLISDGEYSREVNSQQACEDDQEDIKEAATGAVARNFNELFEAKFTEFSEEPTTTDRPTFTATLGIENPRKDEVVVGIGCFLEKRGGEVILGEVDLGGVQTGNEIFYGIEDISLPTVTINRDRKFPFICSFNPQLESGKYDLMYFAFLKNLHTTTSLKRVFFKTQEDQEIWGDIVRNDHFPSKNDALSQSPEEFARLNFGLGSAEDDPFIVLEDSDTILLRVSVENRGPGEIDYIELIDLFSFGENGLFVQSGSQDCLATSDIEINPKKRQRKGEKVYTTNCFLNVPASLANFQTPYLDLTFFADLYYTYVVEKQVRGVEIEKEEDLVP